MNIKQLLEIELEDDPEIDRNDLIFLLRDCYYLIRELGILCDENMTPEYNKSIRRTRNKINKFIKKHE